VTYSIAARDADTGEVGVAVQSQAFNAGAAVPWVRPGIGAVATQSYTDRRYGWRGLELLASGISPADALSELRADDKLAELRQVGMLRVDGACAQWTGASCVPDAGSARGEHWISQANMVASPRVWESMGEAFESAGGPLALRLMAALDAAEAAGGDWRGRGGAGIVVAPPNGEPWERVVDLRVEEGDGSLIELRRLVERALAYRESGRAASDRAGLARSRGLPDIQVRLLAIVDAADAGRTSEARRLLLQLEEREPRWRDAVRSLSLLPEYSVLRVLFDQ
jgi:uncharacterized Ntn-hydrolase superfamily protein